MNGNDINMMYGNIKNAENIETNSLTVNNDATVGGNLDVAGLTTTNGINNTGNIETDTLHVTGVSRLDGNVYMDGNADIDGNLHVEGISRLDGNVYIDGDTDIDGHLNVDNGAEISYGSAPFGSNFKVDAMGVTARANNDRDGGLLEFGLDRIAGEAYIGNDSEGVWSGLTAWRNGVDVGVFGGESGNTAVTITDGQIMATTDDGSGLTINNNPGEGTPNVALLNNTGHGLTINPDNTVLSGGTTSTSLTLNNWGATFNNNGGPARVTGVADGESHYDAVNYGQLQKANIGIASVSALAAIPAVMPCKRFAIGAGYGYFERESAVALGLKAKLWDNISVQAGVGFGVGTSDSTYTANAGFSYSF